MESGVVSLVPASSGAIQDIESPTAGATRVLLTGPRRCGKTTLVRRVAAALDDRRVVGFTTHDVRVGGRRIGVDAVSLTAGVRLRLADVAFNAAFAKGRRLGPYGVDVAGFERFLLRELADAAS
ncbi:MAG: nucleoside-triphosphatase, partial [Planctomycetia bacterium]